MGLLQGTCVRLWPHPSPPTHVEVAVHVEANDAKVIGSGNIRDDTFPAPALLRHPHPHVPVPELRPRKVMKVKTLGVGPGGRQASLPTPHPAGYLLWCGPLGLQLLLVQGFPEHPAQARHGLHAVQERWVFSCVFIPLGSRGPRVGDIGWGPLPPTPPANSWPPSLPGHSRQRCSTGSHPPPAGGWTGSGN